MGKKLREIVESGFKNILGELREINEAIRMNTKSINDKLDSIYNHVYYIERNTN